MDERLILFIGILSFSVNAENVTDNPSVQKSLTSPTIAQILAAAPEDGNNLVAKLDGDVAIGGLFTMHSTDGDIQCGKFGVHGVAIEAMIYGIIEINQREDILPNITLGFNIRDDCGDHNKALQEALAHVEMKPGVESFCKDDNSPIIGIVGTGKSSTSRSVNELVGLFRIPQISFAASSPLLSDKSLYPYFLRTVPSEADRAKVMASLAEQFNWNYVHIVYTDDEFGLLSTLALEEQLSAINVCVAMTSHQINSFTSESEIKEIVEAMKEAKEAKVLFTYCLQSHVTILLDEALKQELFGLTVVTGDAWAFSTDFLSPYREVLTDVIAIANKHEFDKEGFASYLGSLDLTESLRNPWYIPTIKNYFNCEYEEEGGVNVTNYCTGSESLESYASTFHGSIVNAVNVFAIGLHNMLESQKQEMLESLDTQLYLEFLKNVSFETGNNSYLQFDSNGDILINYEIQVLQGTVYELFGEWQVGYGAKLISDFNWSDQDGLPESICSLDCKEGTYLIQSEITCCWTCENCEAGSISSSVNQLACTACAEGERTNENQTACIINPYDFMGWTDIEASVLLVITALSLIIVVGFLCLFIKNRDAPVVKSTSKELSYFLLICIGICFADTFILIGRPNTFQCNFLIVALGISFAFYVGTLMIKTNRISRIFKAKMVINAKYSKILSKSFTIQYQFFFIFLIVIVQVIIQIVWVSFEQATITYTYNEYSTSIECDYGTYYVGPLVTIIYILILAVTCFYQAFSIRKLPEQFNDASFIAFSMLSTVLIWCTFFPIYFTSRSRIKLVICGLVFIFNGIAALGFMFAPKLWIIYFRPIENVNKSTFNAALKLVDRSINSSPITTSARMKKMSFNGKTLHTSLKPDYNVRGRPSLSSLQNISQESLNRSDKNLSLKKVG